MKFPADSEKHSAVAFENWAKQFNAIRAKNANLPASERIPSDAKDEVCQTFEKFPGLFNHNADIEGGKIEASCSTTGYKIPVLTRAANLTTCLFSIFFQEVKIYYFNFFAMFLFFMSASLMLFVILFVIAEHLMILKGGDAFENMTKCSLISGLVCAISTTVGVVLLGVGLLKIHDDVSVK